MPRPATLDHLRSAKRPVTKTVVIALDSELAERFSAARSNYEIARERLRVRPDDGETRDAYEEAEAAFIELKDLIDENAVEFKFRSIGRQAFEDLLLDHPPTKDQKDQARKAGEGNLGWNYDTFPIALIAASSVEPEMSEAEVKEIWQSDDWNQAELMSLFLAALEVNQQRRVVDLGKD